MNDPDTSTQLAGPGARAALAVYVVVVFVFLVAPLGVAVILSFSGGTRLVLPPPEWSLRWFGDAYQNEKFREGLLNSTLIALAAAGISAVAGTAGAIAINHYRFRLRPMIQAILLMPLSLPGVALGLGILFVLPDYGLAPGNAATILGHAVLGIPYVATMVLATLANYDLSLEQASMNLGAGRFETFRRVTLPLILPGTIGGAVCAFLVSFDNVSLSLFISKGDTLPLRLMQHIQFVADPSVAAIATALIAMSLVFAVALGLILKQRGNIRLAA